MSWCNSLFLKAGLSFFEYCKTVTNFILKLYFNMTALNPYI